MSSVEITQISSSKCFGGYQKVFSHYSNELLCTMNFAVYLPPQAENSKCPLIYYLSGLECTEQNFIQKAGFQKHASKYGVVVVSPDTSPRGEDIPNVDKWNIGHGAGFYLNATQEPWSKNYKMYNYVTIELPAIIESQFPVLVEKQSIMGHSMGGHGALLCVLKNPGRFRSVSCFAPLCDATGCTVALQALSTYLGDAPDDLPQWSATSLARSYNGPPLHILIDQGTDDKFLKDLLPNEFVKACSESGIVSTLNMREGYDHGYYFVSTFIKDHFKHHLKYLQ